MSVGVANILREHFMRAELFITKADRNYLRSAMEHPKHSDLVPLSIESDTLTLMK